MPQHVFSKNFVQNALSVQGSIQTKVKLKAESQCQPSPVL